MFVCFATTTGISLLPLSTNENPWAPGEKPNVDEGVPIGFAIARLDTTDPNSYDTLDRFGDKPPFKYTLVGGPDAAKVKIEGSLLVTAAELDKEDAGDSKLRIRIKTEDQGFDGQERLSVTKTITVIVNNVNEPPTGIDITPAAGSGSGGGIPTVGEGLPAGTAVGTLGASDPDSGEPAPFFGIEAGSDNADLFQITGTTVKTSAPLTYQATGPTEAAVAAGLQCPRKGYYTLKVNVFDNPARSIESSPNTQHHSRILHS